MIALLLTVCSFGFSPWSGQEIDAEVGLAIDQHPYLQQLELERTTLPGLEFWVESGPAGGGRSATTLISELGNSMLAVQQRFEREVAAPLGIERRADALQVTVVVLRAKRTYDHYRKHYDTSGRPADWATYDPKWRVVVAFEPQKVGPSTGTNHDRMLGASRAFALAIEQSYTANAQPLAATWIAEGLAQVLAYRRRGARPGMAAELDPALIGPVLDGLVDPEWLDTYWLSLDNLLAVRGHDDFVERWAPRAGDTRLRHYRAHRTFQGLSALWVEYLLEDVDDRLHQSARHYLAALFRGAESRAAFEQAFTSLDPLAVEQAFFRHLEDRNPEDPRVLPDPAELRPRPAFEVGVGASGPIRDWGPPGAERDVLLATALGFAARGDVQEARARLAEGLESFEGAEGEPLKRELERLDLWIAERDRFLRHLVESGAKLKLEWRGERLISAIDSYEEGVLRLAKNRRGLDSVEAESLRPEEVAKAMGESKLRFDARWIRGYGYVLGGHERWERYLDESAAAQLLRADMERGWGDLRQSSIVLRRIRDVLGRPVPDSAARRREHLEEIEDLARFGEHPWLEAARPAVSGRAVQALTLEAEELDLSELLSGSLEDLGEGRLRIHYEFEDAAELDDFDAVDYMRALREHNGPVPAGLAGVDQGAWRASGEHALRHVLSFEPDFRLAYGFRWLGEPGQLAMHAVTAADDGFESQILFLDARTLRVFDKESGFFEESGDPKAPQFYETHYDVALTVETRYVKAWIDGDQRWVGRCDARNRGGVVLWVHSAATFELERFVLEGRPTAESLAALRADWVAQRRADIGF